MFGTRMSIRTTTNFVAILLVYIGTILIDCTMYSVHTTYIVRRTVCYCVLSRTFLSFFYKPKCVLSLYIVSIQMSVWVALNQ